MKLTKDEAAAVLQVYEAYWESYIRGDVKTLASLLDEEYSQIGSVESEVFSNKKDAVNFVENTINQVAGKVEMRNRLTRIEPSEDFIIITEQCDLYVLIEEEWTFYSKFRASSMMQQKVTGWKMIHQHSSLPDSKAEEGENIASEKIAAENLQLRDAIKRRTIELEQKNKELQLESALERVRTIAMGMRKATDLLDICEILYHELRVMGFNGLRNTLINIHDDDKRSLVNYDFSEEIGKSINHLNYEIHPLIEKQIKEIRSADDAFSETVFAGKDLEDMKVFRKRIGEKDDPRIENATAFYYYFYSIGTGSIGISTFNKLTDENLAGLKRFRNVFSLSYQRYIDISLAEAQAREAQIEAALERVRSRSMGMQKSDELKEVIKIVYQQLTHLKINLNHAGFVVDYTARGDWHFWIADEQDIPSKISHSWFESVWANQFDEAKEKGSDLFVTYLNFEEKNKFYKELLSYVPGLPEASKDFYLSCPALAASTVLFDDASLYMENFSGIPYSDEENNTLKRFGKVFQQTYTRFLDLQKAEAQAREAKIEAALERVRFHAMAMQNSEDVGTATATMFNELDKLGVETLRCGILTGDESQFMDVWSVTTANNEKTIKGSGRIDMNTTPLWKLIKKSWSQKDGFLFYSMVGEEKNRYYKTISNLPGYSLSETINEMPDQFFQGYFFGEGLIWTFSLHPHSETDKLILKKFTAVFSLTFRRYLDLKQAEAQAREAQIEAALERVRSKTMAMQRSEQLPETAEVLFQQFALLGGIPDRIGIGIVQEDTEGIEWWVTDQLGSQVTRKFFASAKQPTIAKMFEAWQQKKESLTVDLIGSDLDEWIRFVKDDVNMPMDASHMKGRRVHSAAFFSQGLLLCSTNDFLPQATFSLLVRFAKVFEQTYTRFLDLQKAEAQAIEAKIEAALERTRTQSMIMQHSKELDDTLRVFHEQVQLLGINSAFSFLWLPDEEKDKHIFWAIWQENKNGTIVFKNKAINYPLNRKEPATKQCLVDWKGDKPVVSYAVPPQGVENYFAGWQELIDGVEALTAEHFNNGLYYIEAFMKYGCFGVMMENDLNESEKKILGRFAIEFERTYTRFLDLQKAEAQAREAQIQLALERVRARTMAMRYSSELSETASELFLQLKKLGAELWTCGFALCEKNNELVEKWMGSPITGHLFNRFVIPCTANYGEQYMYDTWQKGIDLYTFIQEGEELKGIYEELMMLPTFRENYKELLESGISFPTWQKFHIASFNYGYLLIITTSLFKEENTFIRFAKVFEQTYTRFLDLQKAEAQTRETQIQLALERVRAKTMAMQHSGELREIAAAMHDQLLGLGFTSGFCSIVIIDKITGDMTWWMFFPGKEYPESYQMPFCEHPFYLAQLNHWKQGEKYSVIEASGEEKKSYDKYTFSETEFAKIPVENQQFMMSFEKITFSNAYMKHGTISWGVEPIEAEHAEVMQRFAGVFEQCYTRFLDLQKAEAQAREAQIQLALERVRARTMAMQKSEELADVATLLFQQFKNLGLLPDSARVFFSLIDEKSASSEVWTTKEDGILRPGSHRVSLSTNNHLKSVFASWKTKKTNYIGELKGKEVIDYLNYLSTMPHLQGDKILQQLLISPPDKFVFTEAIFKQGTIGIISLEALFFESLNTLTRFALTFEQTYTRFLDLQKAEAQAREAQIEAALERVRSKTMAMQRSEQLPETAEVLFQQFALLGGIPDRIGIGIVQEDTEGIEWWVTDQLGSQVTRKFFASAKQQTVSTIFEAWLQKKESLTVELIGSDLDEWIRFVKDDVKMPMDASQIRGRRVHSAAFFSQGLLLCSANDFLPPATFSLLVRFAKVFEQTYTRFLDLEKAEAQAHEAIIEAALEKVRSRSLAMHSSSELQDVINSVFERMKELNITMDSANIAIYTKGIKDIEYWTAGAKNDRSNSYQIPYADLKIFNDSFNQRESGADFFTATYSLDEKNEFFNYSFEHTDFKYLPKERKQFILDSEAITIAIAITKKSCLQINRYNKSSFSEIDINILKRFSRVFEQAYTRFLDLQKAEAQLREAQIEASLERVRSKAMAMHNSNDLLETAGMVFTELRKLGIKPMRAGVGIQNKDNRQVLLYSATSSEEGDSLSIVGSALLEEHPILTNIHDTWLRGEDYFFVMSGDLLKTYYEKVTNNFNVPNQAKAGLEHHGYFLSFSEGSFYGYYEAPISEDQIKTLRRFRAIIDLTFRRYLELQKSESIAKDAIRQASLDRVRAEIASMRTTEDLDRITPLVWSELTTLSIPFVRCGVFIMDDVQEQIHTFLSTPDGKAIAAFHLPYGTSNLTEAVDYWRVKRMYLAHWGAQEFSLLADVLVAQKSIATREQYLSTLPKDGIHLHYLPFLQGMLYVGNTALLKDDDLQLVQSLADAFSTAYARYEDFNKLEAAKQQVDKTLVDLKQAQQQLVQSEKMASLGELTAGIAHEIQNPLNFVNNFSEVSNELIVEMVDEVDKGNTLEVKAIAEDIKQNLEKILHHGKRADAIVKGMLQHSRSNIGVKEPTDINALCDEYLRLCYHGLRAKDKSFNATMQTDFDKTIGIINIIPQDIGRVILNLITNAFYAVNEKKQMNPEGYEPIVLVSTKKDGDKVFVSIKDNGNGIPQKIVDKIFQPFFTTKPTGQGTGLGLSLSYDIVKAHGGEIKVETKEGEGTEFIIKLPVV